MKKLILPALAVAAFALFFIPKSPKPIAQPTDYEQYLTEGHLQSSQAELASQVQFWENKLAAAPGNFVYEKKLASLYAATFKLTGQVAELHRADSLLRTVNERLPGQVGVLQSLTANAITRHAFREAEHYATQALQIGEREFASSLLLTDVLLERGDLPSADKLLHDVASRSHFDYLIREVKMLDQTDQLGKAIATQEQATELAKQSGNPAIINWSLSNLADMYGHDGRIEKSYQTYLEALRHDPADMHSLQGIAWVAFSHDRNTAEAKRILHFLQTIHPVPDYDLLLAEIAVFENDLAAANNYEKKFIARASDPAYGNMYKTYLCELRSDQPEALDMARAEVEERPHPMSYALLAWTSFQNGQRARAAEIVREHVLHRTGEPVALYQSGVILQGSGFEKEGKKVLREALGASYELGPVCSGKIKQRLAQG